MLLELVRAFSSTPTGFFACHFNSSQKRSVDFWAHPLCLYCDTLQGLSGRAVLWSCHATEGDGACCSSFKLKSKDYSISYISEMPLGIIADFKSKSSPSWCSKFQCTLNRNHHKLNTNKRCQKMQMDRVIVWKQRKLAWALRGMGRWGHFQSSTE